MAPTTPSSATTCRRRCSTSPAASTRPRSCWASRGAGGGRRPSPGRGRRDGHRLSGPIDVHMVTPRLRRRGPMLPARAGGLTRRRRLAGHHRRRGAAAGRHGRLDPLADGLLVRQRRARLPVDRRDHQPCRGILGSDARRGRGNAAAELLPGSAVSHPDDRRARQHHRAGDLRPGRRVGVAGGRPCPRCGSSARHAPEPRPRRCRSRRQPAARRAGGERVARARARDLRHARGESVERVDGGWAVRRLHG